MGTSKIQVQVFPSLVVIWDYPSSSWHTFVWKRCILYMEMLCVICPVLRNEGHIQHLKN